MDYDCVIVGGGAAGLSAALVLGRARRRTLLLDTGGQSNRAAAHVGGLLGLDGTPPGELYARGREQVARYPSVELRDEAVVDARPDGDGFALTAGGRLRSRTVLLATGMDYAVPDLPGFAEHWGGAVFHCPFCHGWEVRDRPLVVCGRGEVAAQQEALARGWSDRVTVVDPDDVAGVRNEGGALRAILRRDGTEVPCDAVLVHAPLRPRGDLARRLGAELTEQGLVAVDARGATGVPGLYAAGDCAVAPQQVAVAMASGHVAATMVVRELLLGRLP